MIDSSATLSILADASVAAELAPFEAPQMLAGTRYRLEELIGVGPRTWVYLAVDTALSRGEHDAKVAIKIFRRRGFDPGEAFLVRRVEHPNVVRVLDRGTTQDGLGFIVTEYLPGGDLSGLNPPLPPRRAVQIVRDLARAIQAAHDADVIHCDLKPQNVLMTAAGQVKVTDFDLAVEGKSEAGGRRGNLAFMAPEQLDGTGLSAAADVYALGGLLWYLLTGTFPNGQDPDTARAILAGTQRRPTIAAPGALTELLDRALAIDRSRRYRSAGELADDLDRWFNHQPILGERSSAARCVTLWCQRRPATAIALGFGVLGFTMAVTGWIAWERQTRLRDLAMKEEIVRSATRQVEEMRAQLRDVIGSQIAMLRNMESADDLLPSLVWLDWVADERITGEEGVLMSRQARIDALTRLIRAAVGDGRAGHLDVAFARYCLGEQFLLDARPADARRVLRPLVKEWEAELEPDDILLRCARLLRDWADLETEWSDLEPSERESRVMALRREAVKFDSPQSVTRIAERCRTRVAQSTTPPERPVQ